MQGAGCLCAAECVVRVGAAAPEPEPEGETHGASRNIWLEALQRHFFLACSKAVISRWKVKEMSQHSLSLK